MNYKNKSGTYTITNHTNGKVYYGSSQDIGIRWRDHRSALRRGDHGNDHLQNSWNKHGAAAFTFAIFDYCEVEDLYPYEQILLDAHVGKDYCYNIAKDAEQPMRGRAFSEEHRANISAAHMGRTFSEERKANISAALKGKPKSEEHKAKMSAAQKGKKHSEESKAKRSAAMKGKSNGPQPLVTCPHCGKTGGISLMKRYHFDKCKHKGE